MVKKTKRRIISRRILIVIAAIVLLAFLSQAGRGGSYVDKDGSYKHLTTSTSYYHIYNHPIWNGNGKEIFSPWEKESLADLTGFMSVKALCHWCGWDAETTIDALNYMIDQANEDNVYVYDVYSEKEIQKHPYLKNAKMVFIKGDADKPVAIVAAGGGYTAVRSDTEAFPYAWKLNEKGYNVAVLRYRTGQDLSASGNPDMVAEAGKDMIEAIRFLQDKQKELGISMEGYSLWGSSAGGGLITSFSFACQNKSFQELGIPKPAAQILVYTHAAYFDLLSFQADDVPTFTIVGKGDTYGGDVIMDKKVPEMEEAGMKVEYHKYEDYEHGTGLGIGTSAEGWIDKAMNFWQEQLKEAQ